MKLFIFTLLIGLASCTPRANKLLIGSWNASHGHEEVTMTFEQKGKVKWVVNGNGGLALATTGEYVLQTKENPMRMDIFNLDHPGYDQVRVTSILEFIGEDEMRMDADIKGVRPKSFSEETTLIFRRINN